MQGRPSGVCNGRATPSKYADPLHGVPPMRKRLFISLTVVALIGSALAARDPDSATQRRSIDVQTDEALATLTAKVPGSSELVAKARGGLVFPSVMTAGLVGGGSWGG